MHETFFNAIAFNSDLSMWDVSNVESFYRTFMRATSFNGDITTWNVENCLEMGSMFFEARSFNQDLSAWNVSQVERFTNMFRGASSFNGEISGWNVSSGQNFGSMLDKAYNFNQELSNWDLSSALNVNFSPSEFTNFLDSTALSISNYEATLQGWASNPATPDSLALGSRALQYCDESGRNILLEKGWNISGDSKADEAECLPSSTNSLSELEFSVYPNPTNGEVNISISNNENITTYQIISQNGKVYTSGNLTGNLTISDLLPGLYYLKLIKGNKVGIRKIVVVE